MKKALLFPALALTLFSCGNDDNGTPAANCGTVTVSKNGNNLSTSAITGTLKHLTVGTATGRRLDINAQTPEGRIILTVAHSNDQVTDPNVVKVKTYPVAGTASGDEMLGTFLSTTDNTSYMTTETDVPGFITITSVDGANKRVSGTYNFRADKMTSSAPGDTMRLIGTFTNVCYTVIQ